MQLRASTGLLLLGGSLGLAAAGCSGAGMPGAPPGVASSTVRYGWISPAAKHEKLLYVSDVTSSHILIYKQGDTSQGPVGEISDAIDEPEGIAVDSTGTLYVANDGNNTVTEYAAGSTSAKVTLSTDIENPLDVSVDSNDTVYVTESSANTILEFKKGSTSPDETVTWTKPNSGTNVKNNDLYVTYNASSQGLVASCKPLASTCTDLGITGVEYAQGIAVDLHGNLLVGDVYKQVIDIYKPGKTTPYRTISITSEQPDKLALDVKDKTLYMCDPANFAVRLFNYKTGEQQSEFTFGSSDELVGVALYPGQKPAK